MSAFQQLKVMNVLAFSFLELVGNSLSLMSQNEACQRSTADGGVSGTK